MKKETKSKKIAGIIIVIVAIILLIQAFYYAKYSRREYLIYLSKSTSKISSLTEVQVTEELKNRCLPKLNKRELVKFRILLTNKTNTSNKTQLNICRSIMRETKTHFTISVPEKSK